MAIRLWSQNKLQPGAAGQFHLCTKQEILRHVHIFDAPKIYIIPGLERAFAGLVARHANSTQNHGPAIRVTAKASSDRAIRIHRPDFAGWKKLARASMHQSLADVADQAFADHAGVRLVIGNPPGERSIR